MVLVVVRGPDTLIQGYGESSNGNGRPNGKSLLRLGSITKVFTGEVLAALVNSGKVRLTDPLTLYAQGALVRTPDHAAGSRHGLAGLPRDAGQIPDGTQIFTWPTRKELWDWFSEHPLNWAPGSVAAYSNMDFSLLADALAVAARKPYPELLRELITDPLGMADTTLDPNQSKACG